MVSSRELCESFNFQNPLKLLIVLFSNTDPSMYIHFLYIQMSFFVHGPLNKRFYLIIFVLWAELTFTFSFAVWYIRLLWQFTRTFCDLCEQNSLLKSFVYSIKLWTQNFLLNLFCTFYSLYLVISSYCVIWVSPLQPDYRLCTQRLSEKPGAELTGQITSWPTNTDANKYTDLIGRNSTQEYKVHVRMRTQSYTSTL